MFLYTLIKSFLLYCHLYSFVFTSTCESLFSLPHLVIGWVELDVKRIWQDFLWIILDSANNSFFPIILFFLYLFTLQAHAGSRFAYKVNVQPFAYKCQDGIYIVDTS